MAGVDILLEIDSTLDQLICNAEAVQTVSFDELSEAEIDAFQKTQESLLQHLMHMDQALSHTTKPVGQKSARSQIQAKKQKFEALKQSYHSHLSHTLMRKSDILSKRRGKRFIISCAKDASY